MRWQKTESPKGGWNIRDESWNPAIVRVYDFAGYEITPEQLADKIVDFLNQRTIASKG